MSSNGANSCANTVNAETLYWAIDVVPPLSVDKQLHYYNVPVQHRQSPLRNHTHTTFTIPVQFEIHKLHIQYQPDSVGLMLTQTANDVNNKDATCNKHECVQLSFLQLLKCH